MFSPLNCHGAGWTAIVKHKVTAIDKLCQIGSTQLTVMVEETEGHHGIRCARTPAEPSTRPMNQDGHEKFVPRLLPSSSAMHTNVLAHLPASEPRDLAGTGT